ncbi:hypothetical protein [uncultured Pseudoteredinibacter sp.]|uniref:hypothetical protein n=1 Tax=uncultured Pseudoteredinibacter sp. TaxID=1641701 RepID=UPI00260F377F|nr:hypothetical protein [uncultured Pseudoteredinibacter sp.]
MAQHYRKLEIDFDMPDMLFGIMVLSLCDNNLTIICDCGEDKDHLQISFYGALAYSIHDEFSHPTMDQSKDTAKPPETKSGSYYPALEVIESEWLAEFGEFRTQGRLSKIKHFRFLSGSNIADILCEDDFGVKTISGSDILKVEEFIEGVNA